MTTTDTYREHDFQPARIEEFVEFGDLFFNRQSIGPIRVWRNGKELARLVCDIDAEAGSAGLQAVYIAQFSADEILVVYEGHLLAVWALNELLVEASALPLERKTSGAAGGFRILFMAKDPAFQADLAAALDAAGHYPMDSEVLISTHYLKYVGERSVWLMLIHGHMSPPVLVNSVGGSLTVFRSEHRSHADLQILGPECLAFWSSSSQALVLLSFDGERLYQQPDSRATIFPIGYSNSFNTLYCLDSFPVLETEGSHYVSRLVSVDREAATLRWQGPLIQLHHVISAGNVTYLLFQQNGTLFLMRMDDAAEPRIVPIMSTTEFWPEKCIADAGTGLILGRSGRSVAIIDPEHDACDVVALESPVRDFALIGDLLACAHKDEMFRTYHLSDIRLPPRNAALHVNSLTCIAKLGKKTLLTASDDSWLLWQADDPGQLSQSLL